MTPASLRYEVVTDSERWLFVAGRSFVAAVAPGVGDGTLDALWWLAESDFAEVEAVVGAFPLHGDDEVASFAVASFGNVPADRSEALVTVVVRGLACVDIFSVGGARRFTADGVQPWLLADFRSVTGLALTGTAVAPIVNAEVRGESLPLRAGGAYGRSLVWSLGSIARLDAGTPAYTLESTTGPKRTPARAASEADIAVIGDEVWPSGQPEFDEAGSGRHSDTEDYWTWSDLPVAPDRTGPNRTRETRAAAGADALDDDTLVLNRRPLPPMPDSHTADRARPGGDRPQPAFTLRVGVSETIMLDQPTIIGRNPRAPGLPYGADARLVTVPSPELEVSSSHVEIQQVGEAVVVTDLRSTNGTFILHQDRAPERLRPGESRVLPAGAALDIGDGNIIEIAHIPPAR